MCPWPAPSVSSLTQTHLNEQEAASVRQVNGANGYFADPPSDSGSFDGARLLWDVPRVVTPLVGEGAGFESKGLSVGVEGVLLDEVTAATRGFSLVQQGHLVQIGVPFGAEGGYRKVRSVPSKLQTGTRFVLSHTTHAHDITIDGRLCICQFPLPLCRVWW